MEINKIYNGDCLKVMKEFPDESIDLVVSDIPYHIIAGGIRLIRIDNKTGGILNRRYIDEDPGGVFSRGFKFVADKSKCSQKWEKKDIKDIPSAVKDGKMFEHNDIEFKEWLPGIYRVLKKGTHCYLMINGRNVKDLQIEAEKVGFVFQNLLIWDKTSKTPNKYYMQQAEFILMLSKRPARNINDMGSSNIIRYNTVKKRIHPTEKPISLMAYMIKNSSNEGDIVLDPFAGSGTTLEATKYLKRNYIGIEIDNNYYNIIIKRLKDKENLFDS